MNTDLVLTHLLWALPFLAAGFLTLFAEIVAAAAHEVALGLLTALTLIGLAACIERAWHDRFDRYPFAPTGSKPRTTPKTTITLEVFR